MASIGAFFNEKGGVGKTTLTSLVGGGLAMRGKRVLLIDADGQGDLTVNMDLPRQAGFFRFVKWGDKSSPDYVDVRSIVQRVPQDNCDGALYIVPGNNDSWGIPGSMNLTSIVRNMSQRLRALDRLFDYILIDTQPSATTLHDAIGLVSDWFICPTDAEALSAFGGLARTVEHIKDIREQAVARGFDKARLLGIVPNKFRSNLTLHQDILSKLQAAYGDTVFEPLPLRVNIPESQYLQKTLMQDHPQSTANVHVWSIIDRIQKEVLTYEQKA